MSIFDSIGRNIRNVFVGSHKGDDVADEWFETPLDKVPENTTPKPTWKNPLDSMPVANGNRYAPPERLAELEAEPKNEWETLVDWFSEKKEKPDESDEIEEEKTIHQKMYEMATARYNPFSLGGSENCDSDISCNIGGSERAHK